ncbi:peptidase C39 [Deinococcus irradiatisoli]|uniref:Peptidase C39 n=1 Tax=Deinococcus irradiatisoli TaxID=2202254 RepID=A0A2Z3JEK3_9DEIO|nr:peptidase C39 family protein [Deinococcus irradiatisoli]AWN23472.1 peptidase C39 [Deinococcus irradiatisoli]
MVRLLTLGLRLAGLVLALVPSAQALTVQNAVSTTTVLERAADFSAATLQGLVLDGERLTLAPGVRAGQLSGRVSKLRAFDELIPSWNALTPGGASLTLEVRPAGTAHFYSFGTWQSAAGRSSLNGQNDAAAQLLTDTLRLNKPATAFDYRLTLRAGTGAAPSLSLLAFNTADRRQRLSAAGAAGDRALWSRELKVPPRSQMLYEGGGEVWCSPTSTSMILAYYGVNFSVPEAAGATYDAAYRGTGNWPFNMAFAAEAGLRALVTRLPNLREAERYIAAGIPLGVSLGWKPGELPGVAVLSSGGHLMVLIGFDAQGNPLLNDPAAPSDAGVRRSYPRAAFERLWLSHSGGLAYVITRPGQALPR